MSFLNTGCVNFYISGQGVYQRGVDFLIRRLNEGHWIHFYPEGIINYDKSGGFHGSILNHQTYSILQLSCMPHTPADGILNQEMFLLHDLQTFF